MTTHKCSGKVWGSYYDVSGRIYPCNRPATIERDGEWYCWQHDPERVKVDAEKRERQEEAKREKRFAMYRRQARDTKLATLVTLETAELLERLAIDSLEYGAHGDLAVQARALAAQIREVLG